MRVLLLGLSNIGQRRVVPALQSLGVEAVDVATRKAAEGQDVDWPHGRVFGDYQTAVEQSEAPVVYVSLVNSDHSRWTEAALRAGRHVMVDKPAFLGLAESERLLELADRHGVCLAEATVFSYHPQIQFVRDQFTAAGDAPRRLSVTLSFPPMNPGNFRYQRELGGGALWDVCPYAVSVGRVLFGGEPDQVACTVLARGGVNDVDIAFTMLATYSGGRSVVGNFGFDTVYRNRLDALGTEIGVELDRFFTTVPDAANDLRVTSKQGVTTVPGVLGDSFAAFFAHVFQCIEARSWAQLASDLHADARTLERLRVAAGEMEAR